MLNFNYKYIISIQNFVLFIKRDVEFYEGIWSHLRLSSYNIMLWSCSKEDYTTSLCIAYLKEYSYKLQEVFWDGERLQNLSIIIERYYLIANN